MTSIYILQASAPYASLTGRRTMTSKFAHRTREGCKQDIPRLWRAMVKPGLLAGIPNMVRFTIQALTLKD